MPSLGTYPDVSLLQARERRDAARKLVADGLDPSQNRRAVKAVKAEQAGNSFEVIAREWLARNQPTWGGRPISEISAPDVLQVLRRIESRGAIDTAHRAQQNCGQVFRYDLRGNRNREGLRL